MNTDEYFEPGTIMIMKYHDYIQLWVAKLTVLNLMNGIVYTYPHNTSGSLRRRWFDAGWEAIE